MKLITDNMPALANKIDEPLTGRKFEYRMFPFSFAEMVGNTNLLEEKRMLPHRVEFGYYPDIVMHPGDEQALYLSGVFSGIYLF